MWSIIYLVTGAIFIVLLITIFFSKEKIDSEEIRYFKILIIVNLIEYIFEGLLHFLFRHGIIESFITDVVAKLFLVTILFWGMLFTLYVVVLCLRDKKAQIKKYITLLIKISFVIGAFFVAMLPETKVHELDVVYITGASVDALKAFSFIYIFSWAFLIFISHSKFLNK